MLGLDGGIELSIESMLISRLCRFGWWEWGGKLALRWRREVPADTSDKYMLLFPAILVLSPFLLGSLLSGESIFLSVSMIPLTSFNNEATSPTFLPASFLLCEPGG